MGKGLKNAYGVHICCSFLVLSFLLIMPAVASAQPGIRAAQTPTGETVAPDPLHRLPSSPEEAHQRLRERGIAWPEGHVPDTSFRAASVLTGLRVAIPFDTVEGFTSHPGQGVKVELLRGVPVFTTTVTAAADGFFKADLSAGDIQPGDQVLVTDLADAATALVDCTLLGNMDLFNNRVNGIAPAGNFVDVYITAPSTYYADTTPGAASSKTTASPMWQYSAPFPAFDLRRGDVAYVFSTDPMGNTVMDVAAGYEPGLVVYPQYDDVMGYYQPGAPLTVQAGTATRATSPRGDGFFEAWFSDHDIAPGEQVSCNMGGARSVVAQDVTATCDPSTDLVAGSAPSNRDLRITMDPYGTPKVVQTTSNPAGSFSVDFTGLYDVTGSEVFNVTWYDDDGDAVVYQFQTFSWYLAEGYTGGDFDTWVLVQNPGTDDAAVAMSFQLVEGAADPFYFTLPAGTRRSVHLDELPGLADAQVSTTVTSLSGNWIIAERAVYFTYNGKQGGHDSIGTLVPTDAWYLAEGYTGGDFDAWVLVQNPGTQTANVTMTFQLLQGSAPSHSFALPPGMRRSVHLDELPGLADAQVSTAIASSQPVVAERAMYFTYEGKQGGHDSIGVTASARDWYLAEGYTGGQFDTWVLVQNPGAETATVTLSFQLTKGTAPNHNFTLEGGKRRSVHLDELPGLADAEVSTKVSSDRPVCAERAVYFVYDGKQGGHDSIGTTAPTDAWYLAEGYTGGQFDTWVLVQNPGAETATVTLSFQLTKGTAPSHTFTLEGGKRRSVHLDELPGLADAEVSTKVKATDPYGNPLPVVAERAMYFVYEGKQGGHDSIGVPELF